MTDEQKDVATASQSDGPTAAQLLEQINEKKRELNAQKLAKASAAPEPVPSAESIPAAPAEPAPEPANKPAEPAPESSAGAAPGPSKVDKPDSWKEWSQKKGLLKADGTFDVEKSVRSQRELERELTRRTMQGNGAYAPPQANPPAQNPPMQPRQDYSQNNYPQRAPSEEEIARRYNLDPEDLRRIGPLVADIANDIASRQNAANTAQINRLNREVARNAELQGLKDDPAYHDPRVHHEMNRIVEENPSILQIEPSPWRYAFNEALRTVGRRFLEGSNQPDAVRTTNSGPAPYPTTPPRTAGGGGNWSGSGVTSQGQATAEKFASLPSAEQRKILASLGKLSPET